MHKLALTLMCAYPLATLALTSNAVAAEEGIEARTHNGTEVMKQEPEKAVPAERVFRRPTIVFKNKEKKAEEEAKEKEKFLFPSLAFMAHFDPWKLRLGDVVFLQDNVFSLFKKHPDCRRIQSSWSDYSGRVACRNTSKFLAEGDEVIFSYANVNEVLTGATYTFKSRQRASRIRLMLLVPRTSARSTTPTACPMTRRCLPFPFTKHRRVTWSPSMHTSRSACSMPKPMPRPDSRKSSLEA